MNNNQIGGNIFTKALEGSAKSLAKTVQTTFEVGEKGARMAKGVVGIGEETAAAGEEAAKAAKKITEGTGNVAKQGLGAATEGLGAATEGLGAAKEGLRAASKITKELGRGAAGLGAMGASFFERVGEKGRIKEEALRRAGREISTTKAEQLALEARGNLRKTEMKNAALQIQERKKNIKGKLSDIINKTKTELNKKFLINMSEDTQKKIVKAYYDRKTLFGKSYSQKVKDIIKPFPGEDLTEDDKEVILITINEKIKQYIDTGSFSGGSKTLKKKRKMKNKSTKRKQGTRHKRRKLKKIRKKTLKKN